MAWEKKDIITITLVQEREDIGLQLAIRTPRMCNDALNERMEAVHKKVEAISHEISEIICDDMASRVESQLPEFLEQIAKGLRDGLNK